MMPVQISINLDDEMAEALDRMVADMRAGTREQAAAAAVHDWLIIAGYQPHDGVEEDTPTEGEA
jgi:predicted transcriptional regulator